VATDAPGNARPTAPPVPAGPGARDRHGAPTVRTAAPVLTAVLLLVLAALLVTAGWLLLVLPIQTPSASGFPYLCGSALHPPRDPLSRSSCGAKPEQHRDVAIALGVGAAVSFLGGAGLIAAGRTRLRWR